MTSDLHIFLPPLIINKLNQNVSVGREQSMILILQVRDMDVLVGSQICFAQLNTRHTPYVLPGHFCFCHK